MASPTLLVLLNTPAAVLLIIGMIVVVKTRPSSSVKFTFRYDPIWKQRRLFQSSKEYHRYLVGMVSMALGSLLVGISSILVLLSEG